MCFITTILTYVRGTAYLRLLRPRRLDSPPLMYTNGKGVKAKRLHDLQAHERERLDERRSAFGKRRSHLFMRWLLLVLYKPSDSPYFKL